MHAQIIKNNNYVIDVLWILTNNKYFKNTCHKFHCKNPFKLLSRMRGINTPAEFLFFTPIVLKHFQYIFKREGWEDRLEWE